MDVPGKKKKKKEKRRVFQRGLGATVFGIAHTTIGFIAIVWALTRIFLFGPGEVFQGGLWIGVYNYIYESTLILLWLSGIGLLRARPWGTKLFRAWAVLALFFQFANQWIRTMEWGALSPAFGWGELFLVSYCLGIITHAWGKTLVLLIRDLALKLRTRLKEGVEPAAPGEAQPALEVAPLKAAPLKTAPLESREGAREENAS